MTELWELAKLIRSKNAGPFELTFDIVFDDVGKFDRVVSSGLISKRLVAQLYSLPEEEVRLFVHEQALTIKVSIPRKHPSGDPLDTDLYGGQFHSPLVRLVVE